MGQILHLFCPVKKYGLNFLLMELFCILIWTEFSTSYLLIIMKNWFLSISKSAVYIKLLGTCHNYCKDFKNYSYKPDFRDILVIFLLIWLKIKN